LLRVARRGRLVRLRRSRLGWGRRLFANRLLRTFLRTCWQRQQQTADQCERPPHATSQCAGCPSRRKPSFSITGSSVTRNSTAPSSLRWTWLCQAGTTITSPRFHVSLVPSTSLVPEPLATP